MMEARSAPTIPRYDDNNRDQPQERPAKGCSGAYLGLDILPAPLLGDFLSETLLVHTPVDDGPRDLSGVLSLQEEGFRLGADESEDLEDSSNEREFRRKERQGTYLGVTPNVELSLGGVDLLTGEVAQFDLHLNSQQIVSAAVLHVLLC